MEIVILGIIQGIMLAALAPLGYGIMGSLSSLTSKRGATALWQPYRILIKFRKDNIKGYDWEQFCIFLDFILSFFAAMAIPPFILLPETYSLYLPESLIASAYILAMARFIRVFGASGMESSLTRLGGARNMMFHVLTEPGFLVSLVAIAVMSEKTGTNDKLLHPGMIALLINLVCLAMIEMGVRPFGNPESHLELPMTEKAIWLEHSGKNVMLGEYAAWIRGLIMTELIVMIYHPVFENPVITKMFMLCEAMVFLSIIGVMNGWLARIRLGHLPYIVLPLTTGLGALSLIFKLLNLGEH